ncbi:hypothetical protein K227x_64050 [Rubripirellula lacrimiformis]|uniref:Uncharacterized protein n=1 Tax=Rubripirellula lacrimiformis TaxID=1930273 RepID=A0A517NLH2_9BACT|nr:hypothetical protein [Rubripirellula lacrimiformis]QDT07975.1 hypothetical protein K227x_64050 [Rubripirellula lacrimiformis]
MTFEMEIKQLPAISKDERAEFHSFFETVLGDIDALASNPSGVDKLIATFARNPALPQEARDRYAKLAADRTEARNTKVALLKSVVQKITPLIDACVPANDGTKPNGAFCQETTNSQASPDADPQATSERTKEEVYDEQISPLMCQIIEICKEHKIANLLTFSLDRDADLACTTAMLTDEFEPPAEFLKALDVVRPPTPKPLMMTLDKGDGSKEFVAVL